MHDKAPVDSTGVFAVWETTKVISHTLHLKDIGLYFFYGMRQEIKT